MCRMRFSLLDLDDGAMLWETSQEFGSRYSLSLHRPCILFDVHSQHSAPHGLAIVVFATHDIYTCELHAFMCIAHIPVDIKLT